MENLQRSASNLCKRPLYNIFSMFIFLINGQGNLNVRVASLKTTCLRDVQKVATLYKVECWLQKAKFGR